MQRKLSNGQWVDEDRESEFIEMAAGFHGTTAAEIRSRLDSGQEIRFRADDWYPYIRNEPAPRPVIQHEYVTADCGHKVEASQVMNASRGTCCPMCYDWMSD